MDEPPVNVIMRYKTYSYALKHAPQHSAEEARLAEQIADLLAHYPELERLPAAHFPPYTSK